MTLRTDNKVQQTFQETLGRGIIVINNYNKCISQI